MSADLFDYQMMLRAIKLGERGRINAPPNPWVGCLITKNGAILSEGYHTHAGALHAEPAALEKTTDARHSTVYVTLEPCAHHGRTPPCTQTLIKSGVARVVVGILDPDPRVAGKGIQELRQAGIEVVTGVAEKEVSRSLAPYLHQRSNKSVYTVVKVACSLDGRLCASDGSSQWITGEDARIDAHRLRAESQAIITGAGTVRRDNPRMNVRAPIPLPLHPPLRVVLDSKGESNVDANIFKPEYGPSLIVTTKLCPDVRIEEFQNKGVEVAVVADENGKIVLSDVFALLYGKGVIQTLVEAGPTLTSAVLEKGLFQQLTTYIGPKIIGGTGASFSENIGWNSLSDALSLEIMSHAILGDTIRVDYKIPG